MVNNEQTKIQNEKDLKFYRLLVVMTFVASIIIAMIVGISTMDTYKAGAKFTNAFIFALMPSQIEGTAEEGTEGVTFYVEKNKEYDANKDEPINAFSYYMLTSEGEKVYLEDGVFYPASNYMEGNKEVESVPVYLDFYLQIIQKVQIIKNVVTVLITLLCIALGVGLIYIWYRSWCRREDARQAREEEFNKRFGNKK